MKVGGIYDVPGGALWALVFIGVYILAYRNGSKAAADEYEQTAKNTIANYVSESTRADSAEAVADSAKKEAARHATAATIKERIVYRTIDSTRAVPLPETCDTSCKRLVAERDAIIDKQGEIIGGYKAAYAKQLEAYASLQSSKHIIDIAADSLATVLAKRPKPNKLRDGLRLGGAAAIGYGAATQDPKLVLGGVIAEILGGWLK